MSEGDETKITPEPDLSRNELSFKYRGENVTIPLVVSKDELREQVTNRLLTNMKNFIELTDAREKGIGFVPYHYSSDDFQVKYPEAAESLKESLKKAGLAVSEKPKKLDPIQPRRAHLISWMRENPRQYWERDAFENGTFLIGPIATNTLNLDNLFTTIEDNKMTSIALSGTIALDGRVLLGDDPPDLITNSYIIEQLENVFPPDELK